jgi:hypothetical protein
MTGVSPTKRGLEDNGIQMEDKGGRTEDKNGQKRDESGLANGTGLSSKKVEFTIKEEENNGYVILK